jgi:hypothetical protein
VGILNRAIYYVKNGIKAIWVFDGKAPELKIEEVDHT